MAYNRIFLSHKGINKDIVRQYKDVLEVIGLRPWMDEVDIATGDPLVCALSDGMANSCAVVFFVTPQYADQGFLCSEIEDALSQRLARGDGFRIITLAITDDQGVRGKVPEPLKKYAYGEPNSHLEGLKFILKALPPHLRMVKGYRPLQDIVPPMAKEVALVGQNLSSRLGLESRGYSTFLSELNVLLSRHSIEMLALMMMTPKALLAIHPEAAKDLRIFTLARLQNLSSDFSTETRIAVMFHPAATLSALAVDWSQPEKAFVLITPKFQQTASIYDRISILLDDQHFDSASLSRMIYDANRGSNGAYLSSIKEAPFLLERLLSELGI